MLFRHAIIRQPGDNFARGITTSNLGVPSYQQMLEQQWNPLQLFSYLH